MQDGERWACLAMEKLGQVKAASGPGGWEEEMGGKGSFSVGRDPAWGGLGHELWGQRPDVLLPSSSVTWTT